MPPPISWSALADASVGVWGLGVEGRASLRRLQSMGHLPVLVDDTPVEPSIDGLEVLATAPGGLDTLLRCDVVVKSPGISRYRPEVAQLESSGVAVCGGLGLFMEEADPTRVRVRHRDEGQEHDDRPGRALARAARLPGPGGRQHRPPAVGHLPRAAARLLDRRDVELPGPGPDDGAAGRRGHLAVPGPSRLARHGRPLLRRQALLVHEARRQPCAGRRVRRRVAGPGRATRAASPLDRRDRRGPGHGFVRAPRAPGPAQRAQCLGRPGGPRRPRHPCRLGPRGAGRGGRGLRRAAQPLLLARIGPRGRVRRRAWRRTCCRRRPRWRRSPTGPLRCSSADTIAGWTTDHWARASPPGRHQRWWSPCPTTGHASVRRSVTPPTASR